MQHKSFIYKANLLIFKKKKNSNSSKHSEILLLIGLGKTCFFVFSHKKIYICFFQSIGNIYIYLSKTVFIKKIKPIKKKGKTTHKYYCCKNPIHANQNKIHLYNMLIQSINLFIYFIIIYSTHIITFFFNKYR